MGLNSAIMSFAFSGVLAPHRSDYDPPLKPSPEPAEGRTSQPPSPWRALRSFFAGDRERGARTVF
jgi:hypothetical protein